MVKVTATPRLEDAELVAREVPAKGLPVGRDGVVLVVWASLACLDSS